MKRNLLIFIFLFMPVLVFSAEETIIPYLPQSGVADSVDPDSKINNEMIAVKADYSDAFLAYDSLREDNLSLCGSNKGCRKIARGASDARFSANGRCDKIKDPAGKGHCEDLKNNCVDASGWQAEFCKATINNDLNALRNSVNSPNARTEFAELPTADGLAWKLALYSGFKYSDPAMCQNALANSTLSLIDKVMCSYVFSSDPGIKKQIIRDLAALRLSKKEKSSKYCGSMKTDLIKSECLRKK